MSQTRIFVFLIFGLLCCPLAFAGNSARPSSGDYLEYSLMGLKKSAQDIRDQNKALAKRIVDGKREIEELKQKINAVLENKKQLSAGYEQLRSQVGAHVEQLELVKQKLIRLQKSAEQVTQEESRTQALFDGRQEQDQKYKDRVSVLESEIVRMGEKIQELEYVVNDDFATQVKNYKQSIRDTGIKIKIAQKDLQKLEKEYGKPSGATDQLKRENDRLNRELSILADEHARLPVKEDVAPMESAVQWEEISAVSQEKAARLLERKRELETILVKAKSKMDRITASGPAGTGTADLERNLLAIQAENQALREKYSFLTQR